MQCLGEDTEKSTKGGACSEGASEKTRRRLHSSWWTQPGVWIWYFNEMIKVKGLRVSLLLPRRDVWGLRWGTSGKLLPFGERGNEDELLRQIVCHREQEVLWNSTFILVTWMQLCLKRALSSLLSPFRKNVLADYISRWQCIVNLGPRLCLRTALLNTQAPLLGTVFPGWKVYLSVRLRTFRIGFHLALCLPPLLLLSPSFSSLPSLIARLCFRRVHWMAFPAFPIPPHSSSLWGRNVLPSSW